jgi:capsular polysaccharide biosynthesis protein
VTADDGKRGLSQWTTHDQSPRRPDDNSDLSWTPPSSATTWFADYESSPEPTQSSDYESSSYVHDFEFHDDEFSSGDYESAFESSSASGSNGSLRTEEPDTQRSQRHESLETIERFSTGSIGVSPTPAAAQSTSEEHLRARHEEPRKGLTHNPLPAIAVGLLLAAVFGIAGAVSSFKGKTVYTSTTVMLINDPYQLATSGSSEFLDLDALRSKYSGLLDTDAIAQPVAASLHLSLNDAVGALSAQVPTQSLLLDVEATWGSPTEAQLISQTAANQLTSYVNGENARYNIPANDQISLTTVNPASPSVPKRPSKSHALTLAAGLAVIGFALGFFSVQLVRFLR